MLLYVCAVCESSGLPVGDGVVGVVDGAAVASTNVCKSTKPRQSNHAYPTWDTTRTGRSVDGTDIVGAWLGGNVWANSVGSSVVGVCVHG